MNRPYIVCHILSSLDGRISGTFMGTKSARQMGGEYARIRSEFHADGWMYGTATTKEFTAYRKPAPVEEITVPDGDYVAKHKNHFYYVSVDINGEIGWKSGTFTRPGCPDAHVIEILTEQTPEGYRGYLRKKGVSYILAGKETLDCRIAAEKLYELFDIKILLLCGGGITNWSFAQQGMLDELSLLLAPAAGGDLAASVFEKGQFLPTSVPVEFQFKNVEVLENGGLWLTYLAKNRK